MQQNSNTTYRVYDYDRTDKDGNKRPLHIEQAIAVAETKPARNYKRIGNILAECEWFTVEELVVDDMAEIKVTDNSFVSLIVIDGHGVLLKVKYKCEIVKGNSILVLTQNYVFWIRGECNIILSYI